MMSYLLYHATNIRWMIPLPFSEIMRLYLRCRSYRRREGQDRCRGGVVLADIPSLLDSRLPAGSSAHHPRAVHRSDASQGRRQQVRSEHLVALPCVIRLCHGPLVKRQRTVDKTDCGDRHGKLYCTHAHAGGSFGMARKTTKREAVMGSARLSPCRRTSQRSWRNS